MCLSIRDVLTAYQPIVDTVPGLKTRVDDFRAQLDVLNMGTTVRVEGTAGHTKDKNILRDRVAGACFSIANAIWSHAADINDEILKARIPINLSDFQYAKSVDLIGRFRAVVQEANLLGNKLEVHGVLPADIKKATDDVEAFAIKMNSPKSQRSANSAKLQGLKNDFKAMDTILERLDRSINALMLSQDEFYRAYQKSRFLGSTNVRKEKDPAQPVERKVLAPMAAAVRPYVSENGAMQGA